MQKWGEFGLHEFLAENPSMRLDGIDKDGLIISGDYQFNAKKEGYHQIVDCFAISVVFPANYPNSIPKVFEKGGRIKRTPDLHTYNDGSFCLGSDIRLKSIVTSKPMLTDFFQRVVEPFLYSVSYKIKYDSFPIGDLDHGEKGLIDDYEQFFNVQGKKSVLIVLDALGKRKRVANKLNCPCGCGLRLGKCQFRFRVCIWRKLAKRSWYRQHKKSMFKPIERKKPKKRNKRA